MAPSSSSKGANIKGARIEQRKKKVRAVDGHQRVAKGTVKSSQARETKIQRVQRGEKRNGWQAGEEEESKQKGKERRIFCP